MKTTRRYAAGLAAVVTTAAGLLAATGLGAGVAGASSLPAFVGPLHHITTLASTVPANGDVNPYGVAVIPQSTGRLHQNNILVSNFNNKANVQGTGTTIVQMTPQAASARVRSRSATSRQSRWGRAHHRAHGAAERWVWSGRCRSKGVNVPGPGA